jgi:hypothetical protein
MGSFNVGCGISNLSISEGDKIGFILMKGVEDYENAARRRSFQPPESRAFRVYATDDYVPFLPPVFGVYDDYGHITDVEESVTTRLIEEFFQRPTEAVLNAVGERRRLYSSVSAISELYLPEAVRKKVGLWNGKESTKFKAVGFTVETPEAGFDARYDYLGWKLQKKIVEKSTESFRPDRSTWSLTLGEKTAFADFEGSPTGDVEDILAVFAGATGLLPGFEESTWDAVKLLEELSGMFFLEEVYTAMDKHSDTDSEDKPYLTKLEKDLQTFFVNSTKPVDEDLILFGPSNRFIERSTGLDPILHRGLFSHYVGSTEFMTMPRLLLVLQKVNRMLTPSYNGEQFGNNEAALQLNAITANVLAARKAVYDDEDDYDEDEEN